MMLIELSTVIFVRPSLDGKSNPPKAKVIDGTEAPVNAFPWIVSLQYKDQVGNSNSKWVVQYFSFIALLRRNHFDQQFHHHRSALHRFRFSKRFRGEYCGKNNQNNNNKLESQVTVKFRFLWEIMMCLFEMRLIRSREEFQRSSITGDFTTVPETLAITRSCFWTDQSIFLQPSDQ